jgi:hypothetical protein
MKNIDRTIKDSTHLGSFYNKEDAVKARLEAESKIDPKFFNGNKNG